MALVWRRRLGGAPGLWTLLALCLAVYLPGLFTLPPIDRDESRFAQASRQMMESGDYAVPMVMAKPRLNKPPLIYWLQSLSVRVFTGDDVKRDEIWMYRVPSLLAAIATVLMTWRLGCSMFDARAAWVGAALLAMCPVIAWEAKQARADMVLLAFTTAGMWLLWEVLRHPSPVRIFALWAAIGGGVLTKGPITPMVVIGGLAAWCVLARSARDFWRTKPVIGVLLVVLMVLPWVGLVAMKVGLREYVDIVLRETVGRGVEPAEGHGGFPGYHAVLAVVLLFPGSLFLVPGLRRAALRGVPTARDVRGKDVRWRGLDGWLRSRVPGRAAECFLLCMIVPAWVVFELVKTKLPHYTLPVYPALCLLIGRAALSNAPAFTAWMKTRAVRLASSAWCGIGVGFAGAAAALGWLAILEGRWWGWCVLAIGAAGLLQFVLEGRHLVRSGEYRTLLSGAARVGVVSLVLVGLTLPAITTPWVVSRLVRVARNYDPGEARPLAFVVLHEDSAVFLTRGRAAWVKPIDLRAYLVENPDAMVVMPEDYAAYFPGYRIISTVSGYNYPKGKAGMWLLGEFPP